jgi:hypothetical protein
MNSRNAKEKKDLKALDKMIEEIIVDAYGDDEQLWAFRYRQAFEDNIELPADGSVIGESVSVLEIDYDGNGRCLARINPSPKDILMLKQKMSK